MLIRAKAAGAQCVVLQSPINEAGDNLIHAGLKTPRAAAVAGILFSVLLMSGLVLFRLSVHADPLETGLWLQTNSKTVALGLNLIPFAGIAKYVEKSNRRCYPDIANPPRPSNAQLTVPGSISQPAPAPATSLPLCPQ